MAGTSRSYGIYELGTPLATGVTTELFVAVTHGEHRFKKHVVIKRLLPNLEGDERFQRLLVERAKLNARLVHPKIVQTCDLGRANEVLFVVREYVDGLNLLEVLRELALRERRIEPQLAVWIAHELLDALDYAHNAKDEAGAPLGIVHRGVAPAKVMIALGGDIKLLGFGVAPAVERAATGTRTPKGKLAYLAPEQVSEGERELVDARSDVFSVALMLAELLIGRPMFGSAGDVDTLAMVRRADLARLEAHGGQIDHTLARILRKALARQPGARYPTAASCRDALSEWLFDRGHRPARKHVANLVTMLRDPDTRKRDLAAIRVRPKRSKKLGSVAIPPLVPAEPVKADAPKSRVSTRGMLHTSRIKGSPPAAFAPPDDVRARLGSTQAPRQTKPSTAEVSDGAVGEAAPDSISKAIAVLVSAPSIVAAQEDVDELQPGAALRALFRLSTHRATGALIASAGAVRKEVFLRDGAIELASSNLAEERFADFLLAQGALSAGELEMVLALNPPSIAAVSDSLIALGLIGPRDLMRHIVDHVRSMVVELCTWTKGTYLWREGATPLVGDFDQPLATLELLGAGALALDDAEIETWGKQHRPALVVGTSPTVSLHRFRVEGLVQLHALVDGKRTVGELAAAARNPLQCLRMLRLLEACEQITLDHGRSRISGTLSPRVRNAHR